MDADSISLLQKKQGWAILYFLLNPLQLIIQTTKGIIRDQAMRRKAMAGILGAAVVMLVAGWAFLDVLSKSKVMFLLYWAACAWLTMTAVLLAIFDLLVVRALARQERRRIRMETFGKRNEDGEE